MNIDRFWLLFPGSSGVLKIADQFLFLGVYTDDWILGGLKVFLESRDLLKLRISLWMSSTGFLLLDIDAQGVSELAQQSGNGWRTDTMSQVGQALAQVPQTTAHPLLLTHWIACCFRFDYLRED